MDIAKKMYEDLQLPHQRALQNAVALGESDVQRFYKGRVVFITGGSGFIGKQLIEKLLRSCNISKVFMLLRSKKGKTMQERFHDVISDPVYDVLKEQQPNFSKKIQLIEGDVSDIRLGINDDNWKTLTNEVNIIYHVAATTRFDEPLHTATLINLRGTRECLSLGRACVNLCSFVHVSTAYTHTTQLNSGEDIEEKFYNNPIPPKALIDIAEQMDVERLSSITPELIKDWPNTYTFTKAVTEELIRTTTDGLPICIVRPAIVVATLNEPLPGWLDISAVYGATGLSLGAGLGVVHTVLGDINANLGFVPCDYVNNTIIVAARETALSQRKGANSTKIYTVSPTSRNVIIWDEFVKITKEECSRIPPPAIIYHGFLISSQNQFLFAILSLLFHVIPAYIADFVCLLLLKERRFVKLTKKMYRMCNALSYFISNDWVMKDQNTTILYDNLSDQDKVIFNFNITDINWAEYVTVWCLGIRKFIIKDGLKNTDVGLKKMKYFKILHYGFITPLYIYMLWKILYFCITTTAMLLYKA